MNQDVHRGESSTQNALFELQRKIEIKDSSPLKVYDEVGDG